MLPVLQLGPFALQTYPLAVLAGVWAGLTLAAHLAGRHGIDGDHIYNAGIYALVAGLLAGRVAHVVAFWSAYRLQPLSIVGLNTRAFLVWPGVVMGLLVAIWYVRRHGLAWPGILDAVGPGALLSLAVVALGSLLAGRDLGATTTVPWAVTAWGETRHPATAYEMLALLASLAASVAVFRSTAPVGSSFWTAVLSYGLVRLALEPFHAESSTIAGGWRTAQLLGLAGALVALWALRRLAERRMMAEE